MMDISAPSSGQALSFSSCVHAERRMVRSNANGQSDSFSISLRLMLKIELALWTVVSGLGYADGPQTLPEICSAARKFEK